MAILPQRNNTGNQKNQDGILRTGSRRPGSSSPNGGIEGDLWYDTSLNTLKAYDGANWVPVGSSAVNSWELNDQTLFLRTDVDNCHRIKYASGTQGDLGSMDGVAILGNGRSALFSSGCGGGSWRFIWDSNGDCYISEKCYIGPKANAAIQAEPIATAGGGSGISMISRNSSRRFVIYPQEDGLLFWNNQNIARIEGESGSGRAYFGTDIVGRTLVGPWIANGGFASFVNFRNAAVFSSAAYSIIAGSQDGGDSRTYIGASGNAQNQILFRLAYNGTTVAAFGGGNFTTALNSNICLGLTAGVTGNVVHIATGSTQIGYDTSSGRAKENIRTLRNTPERDTGTDNPIFKLRPVRFKWKKKPHPKSFDGLANADEINALHPNGVAGLLAEEVAEVCPDGAAWFPGRPEWHWTPEDGLPENDENGDPILYKPEEPPYPNGINHTAMLAYLIDAIQHIKTESDNLKEESKLLKDEIKLLKRGI